MAKPSCPAIESCFAPKGNPPSHFQRSLVLAQIFLATHAPTYDTFNTKPQLIRRPILRRLRDEARQTWARATAKA